MTSILDDRSLVAIGCGARLHKVDASMIHILLQLKPITTMIYNLCPESEAL